MNKKLGIVGAGKLGVALGRSAVEAGFDVLLTSAHPEAAKLIVEVMAPGANAGSLDEVAAHADVIVLAVPLNRFRDIPGDTFEGKVLVDAINYWEPVDGNIAKFGVEAARTSEIVQAHFTGAHVVKSLNQLGYHDVEDGRRPKGSAERLGVAVAGDDASAVSTVKSLVETLGFDSVDAGSLRDGWKLGPGGKAFGATLTAKELREALRLPDPDADIELRVSAGPRR